MSKQIKTNNWNYLNSSIFNRVNRLFVVSFEDGDDGTSFSKYRTPSVEIKDFNVLIESKSFFDVPIKSKKKHMKQILKWVKLIITQLVIY